MSDEREAQRSDLARHRENAARPAAVFTRFESTGQGTVEFAERVDFGLTFIEMPFISYGSQVEMDDLAEQLDLPIGQTPALPQSTGYVTDWDTDDRGFYTGAWVAATVYDPTGAITPDIQVIIEHHFTFQAVALKDIPLDLP